MKNRKTFLKKLFPQSSTIFLNKTIEEKIASFVLGLTTYRYWTASIGKEFITYNAFFIDQNERKTFLRPVHILALRQIILMLNAYLQKKDILQYIV